MPKLHSQKPLNRWTTNAASPGRFWRTGKLSQCWALDFALSNALTGGQRWGLLSSKSAANLEENPSLSLLHLCLSHQTTATREKSFPFSCEHLPPKASCWDGSCNHKHGKEDPALISLSNISQQLLEIKHGGYNGHLHVALSFDPFTFQHSSHEQLRGGSCSLTAFPFVKRASSFAVWLGTRAVHWDGQIRQK